VRHARTLACTCAHHRLLQTYDLREIDSDDEHDVFHLKYVARLEAVVQAARRLAGPGGAVLEVGCSQANAGLLLAEAGLTVLAIDLLPEALTYALAKHARGAFRAVAASAEALPVRDSQFDCVLLGELLEHCAEPPKIIAEAARVLRPGGHLVVTTPNGQCHSCGVPLYRPGMSDEHLRARQFGAEGADHLFAFTRESLRQVLSEADLLPVHFSYLGGAVFSNRLGSLKRRLTPSRLQRLARLLNRLPSLGRRFAPTLLAVAEKTGS
jgi:2-polyprenyl-6-hydroxyphenyl methylase/3-demethylubiquinone-9 3-methyltransferase